MSNAYLQCQECGGENVDVSIANFYYDCMCRDCDHFFKVKKQDAQVGTILKMYMEVLGRCRPKSV
jgi:hypothetical protein